MSRLRATTLLLLLSLLSGCSDNDATVTKYDKSLSTLPCLSLVVFPPDALIQKSLANLYTFKEDCPYELQVSRKSGIVCNSNQNAQAKALSNFPHGFIRFDIYKERKPLYCYYKDLTSELQKRDIEDGFNRLRSDFHLK